MIDPTCTIHKPVVLAPTVETGMTCTIWSFTTICGGTILGREVVIGANCWIGHSCVIGDGTRLQTGVFIPNDTIIGKGVFIGPHAVLTDDKYPQAGQPYTPMPPVLGDYCSIGAGAVILPGVRIGAHAMVGAGAVVSQDVPPHTRVVGVPARILPHDGEKESHGNSDN